MKGMIIKSNAVRHTNNAYTVMLVMESKGELRGGVPIRYGKGSEGFPRGRFNPRKGSHLLNPGNQGVKNNKEGGPPLVERSDGPIWAGRKERAGKERSQEVASLKRTPPVF